MLEEFEPSDIEHPIVRQQYSVLLNLLEKALSENSQLKEEIASLKDEIIRLKGGQGRPPFSSSPSKNNEPLGEFKTRKPLTSAAKGRTGKAAKNAKLRIDRIETLTLDPTTLPKDAQFKGYEKVLVQDVKFQAETILFRKARYYSASQAMRYTAPLPKGYSGQFEPGVKAWVLNLYYAANMSEPKLVEFLHTIGLKVSSGQLSNWLSGDHSLFAAEKAAVVRAGLESTPYQHLDSTATGLFGQTYQCHILCNPFYTAYTTLAAKDRYSMLKVLLADQPRRYRLTTQTLELLTQAGVSAKTLHKLATLPLETDWSETELDQKLGELLPKLSGKWVKKFKELMALASYHARQDYPVVELLVTDDAPQFEGLTSSQALCWLHEIRHYTKLRPQIAYAKKRYSEFLDDFWQLYRDLTVYRAAPSQKEALRLTARFDRLFKGQTGYDQLDERKQVTFAKKEQLLQVLKHPELELHNNPAELAARQRVRKRDVSLQACQASGLRAWDTFQSLVETAKKLGVNSYAYFYDRISATFKLPSLATLIQQKPQALNLNHSWQNAGS